MVLLLLEPVYERERERERERENMENYNMNNKEEENDKDNNNSNNRKGGNIITKNNYDKRIIKVKIEKKKKIVKITIK